MNIAISLLIRTCVVIGMGSTLYSASTVTNKPKYFKRIVQIDERLALGSWLYRASEQSGVAFCLEVMKDQQEEVGKQLGLGGQAIAVAELLSALEKAGCKCRIYDHAVVVSTPGVTLLKDNPLDAPVEGFRFKGDHAGFVEKISLAFPEVGPNMLTGTPPILRDVQYEMKIEGRASIRDVLMEIASKYGVYYRAEIRAKTPIWRIMNRDGSYVPTKAGRVDLRFGRITIR